MEPFCLMSVQPPGPERERECPACGAAMVVDSRFITWCTACEWNAEPDPAPKRKFVALLAARQADGLARRLYADVSAHPLTRRRGLAVLTAAYLLAAAVHLVTVALLAAEGAVLAPPSGIIWPVKVLAGAFLPGLAWGGPPFHRRRGRRTT